MWGYVVANVGMSKQAVGDRVSTLSLQGCSTSVALTMGPTDEEEEEEDIHQSTVTAMLHSVLLC